MIKHGNKIYVSPKEFHELNELPDDDLAARMRALGCAPREDHTIVVTQTLTQANRKIECERHRVDEAKWLLAEAWRDYAGPILNMVYGLGRWRGHYTVTKKDLDKRERNDGPLIHGCGPCWLPDVDSWANIGLWLGYCIERYSGGMLSDLGAGVGDISLPLIVGTSELNLSPAGRLLESVVRWHLNFPPDDPDDGIKTLPPSVSEWFCSVTGVG